MYIIQQNVPTSCTCKKKCPVMQVLGPQNTHKSSTEEKDLLNSHQAVEEVHQDNPWLRAPVLCH